MSRFLLIANVLLIASVALILRHWHSEKVDARRKAESLVRNAVISAPISPKRSESAPLDENPRALATAAVQQFVFSRDRNPDVIERVSETPVPALPTVYGTLLIGDSPAILLGFGANTQHAYQAGERVGPFRLVSFDSTNITLEWTGREIKRPIQDLAARQDSAPSREPLPAILAAMPATPRAPTQQMGPALSESEHACIDGDQQPPGTITADGFRKVVTKMPFGEVCRWMK